MYAWDGFPACTSQSAATVGTGIAWAFALWSPIGALIRHSPALVYAFYFRKLKRNAAGSTFLFCLLALIIQIATCAMQVRLVWDPTFDRGPLEIISNITNICLALAVLNMSFAFLELSSSMTTNLRGGQRMWRRFLYIIVATIVLIVAFEAFLSSAIVQTLTGVVIIVGVAIAAFVGPAVLYVHTARSIVRSHDVNAPRVKLSLLLVAMAQEILLIRGAMNHAIGISTGWDSKGSRQSSREASREKEFNRKSSKDLINVADVAAAASAAAAAGNEDGAHRKRNVLESQSSKSSLISDPPDGNRVLPRVSSKEKALTVSAVFAKEVEAVTASASLGTATPPKSLSRNNSKEIKHFSSKDSKDSSRHGAADRHFLAMHARTISFLGRTIRMGFWLAIALFVFIFTAIANVFVSRYYQNVNATSVTTSAMLALFTQLGYTGSIYELLIYLEPTYVPRRRKEKPSNSKPNSKADKHEDSLQPGSLEVSKIDSKLVTLNEASARPPSLRAPEAAVAAYTIESAEPADHVV